MQKRRRVLALGDEGVDLFLAVDRFSDRQAAAKLGSLIEQRGIVGVGGRDGIGAAVCKVDDAVCIVERRAVAVNAGKGRVVDLRAGDGGVGLHLELAVGGVNGDIHGERVLLHARFNEVIGLKVLLHIGVEEEDRGGCEQYENGDEDGKPAALSAAGLGGLDRGTAERVLARFALFAQQSKLLLRARKARLDGVGGARFGCRARRGGLVGTRGGSGSSFLRGSVGRGGAFRCDHGRDGSFRFRRGGDCRTRAAHDALSLLHGGALLGAPARAALFAAVRADNEQNEHEQHEKGCEPDADDGDRAHRRDLHTRSADGEGEVAAHRAGVDILPRAALADVDAKITAVLGREVADGVLCAAVVGKVELPLLEHLAVGGKRWEFSAAQAGKIALQAVKERTGLHVECLGRDRLGGQLDGVAVVVAAFDKQDGKTALACLLGGKTGGVGLIHGRDNGVEMERIEVCAVPMGMIAIFFGNVGDVALVKGRAIGERAAQHLLTVGKEGEREGLHALGHACDRGELGEGDRLGAADEALTVDAGQVVGDIVVVCKGTGIAAGDRARVLLAVGDVNKGVVPRHAGAAAVGLGLDARADDAADILLAAERALGVVAADRRAGHARDAADIAAVFTRGGAVALAGGDIAEVHAPDDAADIAALAGDVAGVDALLHDGLVRILLAVAAREAAGHVVLGVERILDGHGAGNAAGVHIAVDGGGIFTAGDLAERDGVDVNVGGVGDDAAGAAADTLDGGEHGVRQLVELAVDRAQVARERARACFDVFGDQRELAARRGDRADDRVEVRHADNVGNAGMRPDDDAAVNVDARRGDGVEIDVHAHIARGVRSIGEVAGDEREAVTDLARAVLRVVHGLFDKAAELIELRLHHGELAGGDFGADIGLHLSGDAADVLAPADRAAVCAGAHLPAAASDDAADIVADVLVADGGLIYALADRAGGVARDAAGVGRDAERVELGKLGEVERELKAQIV